MKKQRAIMFIGLIVFLAIYVFITAPNLNPLYITGAFFWLVVSSACLLIATLTSVNLNFLKDLLTQDTRTFQPFDKSMLPKRWVLTVLVISWGFFFLSQFIFTPLFFVSSYKNQMAEPEIKEFSTDMQTVDINQIPVVDRTLALTLADKKLGEKPSLGSQVRLGEPTMQNVNGNLMWVVPLEHSGFFKWLSNIEGAKGYITVSATNLNDVEYVEDYNIKIQPNSFFMDDLARTVRFKGGLFEGITDYSFELDDAGNPYWVVTTYSNTCGFYLPEATGVIIVDATNGKMEQYSLNNIPEWVDRVQPVNFIINQINNKGQYIHGVFNFSNKEKYMVSQGENIVYNNGKCYLFTGITSVGSDESATGFYMVDMVTKEPTLYRMSGATEISAMRSAQGNVQDLGYNATAPILLNVYDEPTYFMTLKDNAMLIKKYAFVSVKNYMIVGTGDTIREAQQDYAKGLKNINVTANFGSLDSTENKTISGTIDRISFTISNNTTIYNFTLDEGNEIYSIELDISNKITLTQKGDKIKLTYLEYDNEYHVTEFENTSF